MSFTDLVAQLPQSSFRWAGAHSKAFLEKWLLETSVEEAPGGSLTHVTRTDPESGLKVTLHVRRFDDFRAVEWVVEFQNGGRTDTPIIEHIELLDISIPVPRGEMLRLHHANGSYCRMDDFLPLTTALPPNTQKAFSPHGGRSSNGAFPFMNLQRDGCGLVLAIGWSGQCALVKSRWDWPCPPKRAQVLSQYLGRCFTVGQTNVCRTSMRLGLDPRA